MINHQSGFIALISAIIIAVLLLTITFTVSMSGIFGRLNILDAESKERSSSLAEACADTAILKLSKDSTYTGNECISVGDSCPTGPNICNVVSVSAPVSNKITIFTSAVINKAHTNLKVIINSDDLSISSWEEIP